MMLRALMALAGLLAPNPYIAVIQKVGGSVGFYSEDGKSLAQVQVGAFPHEAAVSPDGRTLYVSDNGILWMTEDSMGTNTISVVDIASMKKTATIDLGRFHRPHGLAFAGKYLLATTERPFGLVMVDVDARKVVRDFDVKGKSPHMVMPTRDAKLAFVSNSDSDSVAAITLATGETKLIPGIARPQGAAFSPDGSKLYVTASNANQIAIIDVAQLRVTGTIQTGKSPNRIAVTPDGKTLVYSLQKEPAVGFADVASRKQTTMVPLSGDPLSLTMTPDGKRAFSGIQAQDKIVLLSVAEKKIERVIDLPKGSGPDPVIPLSRK